MDALLEKIQKLNSLLKYSTEETMPLQPFIEKFCKVLRANIYLFQQDGEILCRAGIPEFKCDFSVPHSHIPDFYQKLFNEKNCSIFNHFEEHPQCDATGSNICNFRQRYYCIIPIFTDTEKKAGILFVRYGESFAPDEKCLCEYTGIIVSLALLYQTQANLKEEFTEKTNSQLAVKSLSYSELYAFSKILDELNGDGGHVILSRIAEKMYVTRSVLTNTIKKLSGAGVIAAESMGVKGTYISIENKFLVKDTNEALVNE